MLPILAIFAIACAVAWWLFRVLLDVAINLFNVPLARPKRRMWSTVIFTLLFALYSLVAWFGLGASLVVDSTRPRPSLMFGVMVVSAALIISGPLVIKLVFRCITPRAINVGLFISILFATALHLAAHGLLSWKGY